MMSINHSLPRAGLWRTASFVLVLFALLVALTPAEAQQDEESIFRLLTFQTTGELRLGATEGNGQKEVVDIHNAILALKAINASEVASLPYIPADMRSLIEVGDSAVSGVKTVYRAALAHKADGSLVDRGGEYRVFHPATSVRIKTPIPNPHKMFGLAGNYFRPGDTMENPPPMERSTQEGLGRQQDRGRPSPFLKSVASLCGPEDEIVMTDLLTDGLPSTHELELAYVISKRAKNVSEADAMDYVFGYTIHNDVSGRTLQTGASGSEGSAMTKGMDTFGATGPYITLKEDVPDPYNLKMETRLNGEVFPTDNAHSKYMRHKIPAQIALISHIMTLEPGDIIATGVPQPTAPLEAGDTVELYIERLGTLRNYVVKYPSDRTSD
jgi:2-keto-4-pentenoate hydratase/2-oxohepta-3-ene-1,7-dioic acid hydratase in catechol pathway